MPRKNIRAAPHTPCSAIPSTRICLAHKFSSQIDIQNKALFRATETLFRLRTATAGLDQELNNLEADLASIDSTSASLVNLFEQAISLESGLGH